MELIKFTTCNSSIDAHIIKTKLESEDVEVFLVCENFTNLLPGYNNMFGVGVQVMINAYDLEKAIEIVSLQNQYTCSSCGGEEFKVGLGKKRINKFFAAILSLLVVMPLGNIQSKKICVKCGNES